MARAKIFHTLAISSGDLSCFYESFNTYETAYQKEYAGSSVSKSRIGEIYSKYANTLFEFSTISGNRESIQIGLKKYKEAIRINPTNRELVVSLVNNMFQLDYDVEEKNTIHEIIPMLEEQLSLRSSRIARIRDRISRDDPILSSVIYPAYINFLIGKITANDNRIKESFEIFENHLKHNPMNNGVLEDWIDFLIEYATMKEGVIREQLLGEAKEKAIIAEEAEEGSATESLARIYALEYNVDNSLIWIMKYLSKQKICHHNRFWLMNKAFDAIKNDPGFREMMFYYQPKVTIKDGIEGLMKRIPSIESEIPLTLVSNAPEEWPDIQMNPFNTDIDPLLLKITFIASFGRTFDDTEKVTFSLFKKYLSTMGVIEVPLVVTSDTDEYPIFIFHEPGKGEREYCKFVSDYFSNRGMKAIYYSTSAFEFSTLENNPNQVVNYASIPSDRKEDQIIEKLTKVTSEMERDIESGVHVNAVADMLVGTKPQMDKLSLNNINRESDADGKEDWKQNFRWMFNGFTGTVFQENDDFELDQTFAVWWSTKEEPLFRDSPSRQYLLRAYQAMDGIEREIYSSILADADCSYLEYDNARRRLPLETKFHQLKGPEDVPIIMSVSREKGIRFAFPISSTTIEYRCAFHKNFARYCEFRKKWIEKINIDNPMEGSEIPEERPLILWKMVEASTINTQESEECTEMNIGAIMPMNMH